MTGFPFLLIHCMCHCQTQLTLYYLSHHLGCPFFEGISRRIPV